MLFNPEIQSIESDILYHETQIEEAQERLDQVKMSAAYSDTVISSLEDFLDNTDPFLYEVLKSHLNQMFDENKLTLNNDFKEEVINETPQEIIEKEEQPFSKDQESKEPEKEFGPLSYYQLTGKPDTRPDTFEDLAPNITYSSSGRAYVGFHDRKEAEKFRDNISEPAMISDTDTMNDFKYVVKFYCKREYVEEIANSVDEPLTKKENFEEINSRVVYSHSDRIVYLGMTSKNRCNYYGQYLTGQLTVGEKYTVSSKPSFINADEYKYELRITEVTLDDVVHLASFNLQKDPEHPDNAKLLTDWRANKLRQHPSAYTPLPKAIALEDVKLGDIITTDATKLKDKQYKVLAHKELEGIPHVEAICIFNREMPALVNNCSWFKEVYPVATEDVCIDPQFSEVLTENVNIYVPVSSETSSTLTPKFDVTTLEPGDTIRRTNCSAEYTVTGLKEKDGEYFIEAECISHPVFQGKIGESFTFRNYCIEKVKESIEPSKVIAVA